MPKVIIVIHIKKGITSKLTAEILRKSIDGSLKSVVTHESIEKIESRVEP